MSEKDRRELDNEATVIISSTSGDSQRTFSMDEDEARKNVLNPDLAAALDLQRYATKWLPYCWLQLLGVLYLGRGTGEKMARAVMTTKPWNLKDMVRAICFNTTVSNTGYTNGACASYRRNWERSFLVVGVGIISSNSSCRLLSLCACDGPVAPSYYCPGYLKSNVAA